ncbi:MAG: PAS domain S-box protein [Deltaproteobacteria bacterium]|nr:PAS domain S-box protein [Deltaproteobacteria bacterium]
MAEKLPAILNFLTTFAEMVAGVGIDRLKLIEAAEALKEREAIFRTIIEHSNEMFYIHDTEHVLTYASPTSENLLGYTSEEMMINWTNLATDNPINQKGIRFTEKSILTGKKQAPYLLELQKKNGASVLVEIDESPVKDISGKVVAISGALRDVTEQKKTQQKLLKSEKGFRDLFDSITDLIYTQDLEGRFISANHAMSYLFGYEKDAFIGKPASEFMKPEIRPYFKREYLEKIKTEGFVEGVSVYFSKAGKKIYIEYRSSLVEPEDGAPYISGSGRDVTERVLSQKKIKRLQKQIVQSQKMEAMGLMAGGVAHDLNNILSGIVSYPELLLIGLPEDSPLKRPIQTIYESGKRAAEVVEDLLTVARGVATGKEVLNLNNTVNEYMASLEYGNLANTCTAVRFKTALAADLLSMNGSQSHIRKVLMNLLINASEAIEGSGTVTIATLNRYLDEPLKGYRDVHTGEYVMLTVSDDGSGISPEDLERIFEPFYTKKVMGRSGTGLGLAVVWNTVQEHNGYINVETSGAGTIFELYFPVTRDERISKNEPVPLKDYLGHGEKILVVDDEEGQREIACDMLTKLGYAVEAVSSGEEAVQYVKESPVDLIVLDMIMPKGMNGRETYQEIIKIHPSQKAVIASGYAKTLEVDFAKKLGAGHYIKKPYTLERIGVAVKDELNG